MTPDIDTKPNMEHRIGGPAYRWKLAQRYVASRSKMQLDEITQQTCAYMRIYRQIGWERATSEYPAIAAAVELSKNNCAFQSLKLSVLANLPRAEVAARLGVTQEIIEVAEKLFFEIHDMAEASSWMASHVFVPEAKFGSKELAARMKVAFYGGPVLAHALLDAGDNLPINDAQRLVDQETLLHSKLQAALAFDLDTKSAEEFLKIYLEYDLQVKQLQFEREKFQYECEQARETCMSGNNGQAEVESSSDPHQHDSTENPGSAQYYECAVGSRHRV